LICIAHRLPDLNRAKFLFKTHKKIDMNLLIAFFTTLFLGYQLQAQMRIKLTKEKMET